MPVVLVDTQSTLDFTATTTAVNLPHYLTSSTLDLTSSAAVSARVAVQTSSTLDITSVATPIFDVVTSQSVLDFMSTATQNPVGVVATSTALDITSAATQKPVVTVASQSVLDFTSTVSVLPGVPLAGTTVLDITSSATQQPVAVVESQSTLDITSEGTVVSAFKPQGMTKVGTQTVPIGMTKVTGWTANADSVVTSNALVITDGKSGAVLNAKVIFSANYNTRAYALEVRRGATVLASKSGNGTVSGVMSLTIDPTSVTVANGDQITFWANSAFTANGIVVGTFLTVA